MSAAKLNARTKSVPVKAVGTTVWGRFEMRAEATGAGAKSSSAKQASASEAPAKRASAPVTVTVFDTPLRPRHATRATLAAAARSVK